MSVCGIPKDAKIAFNTSITKRGKAGTRYEAYKNATTIQMALRCGASVRDIAHDLSKKFLVSYASEPQVKLEVEEGISIAKPAVKSECSEQSAPAEASNSNSKAATSKVCCRSAVPAATQLSVSTSAGSSSDRASSTSRRTCASSRTENQGISTPSRSDMPPTPSSHGVVSSGDGCDSKRRRITKKTSSTTSLDSDMSVLSNQPVASRRPQADSDSSPSSKPVAPPRGSDYEEFVKSNSLTIGCHIIADSMGEAIAYRFMSTVVLLVEEHSRYCERAPPAEHWRAFCGAIWKTALAHELSVAPSKVANSSWNFKQRNNLESDANKSMAKALNITASQVHKAHVKHFQNMIRLLVSFFQGFTYSGSSQ